MFKWKGKTKRVCYVGTMNIGFIRKYKELGNDWDWFTRLDHPSKKQWRPMLNHQKEAEKHIEDSFKHWVNGCKDELLELIKE